MKRSGLLLVSLSGAFVLTGLGLMVVSAEDKELYRDLTNAVQHIDEVKFTHTGSNPIDATMKRVTNKEVIGIKAKNFNITQKGGNYNNIGASVSASSILGGSKNRINGGSHNVIIAGSQNTVDCGVGVTVLGGEINTARGNYTTILGGKNNTVEGCSSSSSVIAGGSDNTLKGQNSVVVGTNNRVVGSNSVAMGKNSKVEASNSFLWTDGNQNGVLNSGNVFAVVSEHGMVVNTNKAHNFAKLTIGGSLVLYGDDHGNFAGLGGGKIKVVNGDSNYKCFCSYDGEKWNSLFGKGTCNYYCNNGLSSLDTPKCGTQVYKKCGSVQYYYSGTCEKGKVVEGTGAYILDKENKIHWTCQTDDGKIEKCVGTGITLEGTCGETSKCRGILPANAELNNPIAVADGGQYHLAPTTDQSACAYHCKQNYNGTNCVPDEKENVDCTGLPANAKWVKGKFKQKWNGSFWYPIVKQITYKPASQGGASVECSYECIDYTHYYWDGTRCVAKSQLGNCTGNPTNSSWVSGTFRQIWGGNAWKPASIPARHISNNSIDCYYKCDSSHVRNGSDCSCPATAGFGESCCSVTTCTDSTESGAPSRFCTAPLPGQAFGKCEECTNYGGECRRAGGDLGVCVLVNGAGECKVAGSPTPGPNPDPTCNIATAGNGEACCSTALGDSMDTVCRPDKKENNDYQCLSHKVCEECDNYGGRCGRSYYKSLGLGQGICFKHENNGKPFGECVACFGDNQTYIDIDGEAMQCANVECGDSIGECKVMAYENRTGHVNYGKKYEYRRFNTTASNGSWTCSEGDANINGVSTVSCGVPQPDPEPELYPNITYSWIDYCHMHPNGGCVDCNKWPTECQAAPQTQYISSTVWINLVAELGFFKDGDYISNDSTVIGKKGNTDIKLSDIDWSISVGDYSDKVNSNGSIKKYWMTIPDSVTVPWGATTTVRFKGSYDGTVLIDESLTEEFVKDEASCKVDSNGNISGKWFNASGKICSAGS